MKSFTTILLIIISTTFFAQEYNLKKGYVAEGYDVVSYFSNTAEKGDTAYTATFEIRAGKLYLFYNSWGINTFETWKEEGPEKLKVDADKNWVKIKEEK